MNKYRNKKVQVDMYVFDSIAESRRYKEGHFIIESIVTHEQFASIEYKVEEEK